MKLRNALLGTTALIGFASTSRSRAALYAADPMMKRSDDSAWMLPYWNKTDDLIDGIDALRAEGETYLPKFPDEDPTDYKFRLSCTKLTNIYSDIIDGLASKPFEEPVALIKGENGEETAPAAISDFTQDVDGAGNTMTVFASQTFYTAVNSAIDWIFVDYSKRDPSVRSVADARRVGQRVFWSHVLARNVLWVQSAIIGGEEVLTYFKVYEPGKPDHIREFTRGADGVVTWILYEYRETTQATADGTTRFFEIDRGEISIGEIPFVPLVTGRRIGRSWKILPAMRAAADLQIELYQQESDLKYAKKLTAFPMLAANGIAPPMNPDGKTVKKIAVSPARVLYSTPDSATGKVGSWSYVEPNSESLKFLAEDIKDGQQALRELGKQPLTAQAGNITVITAAVAAGKAKSAVKAWAYKLKDALENALLMTAKWMNVQYDPIVHVFVDFDEYMEGEDIDALLTMSDKGKISDETLYEEMKRRTVLSSNFTTERERQRLLKQLPGDGPDTEPDAG
jgi:hypothetical protein